MSKGFKVMLMNKNAVHKNFSIQLGKIDSLKTKLDRLEGRVLTAEYCPGIMPKNMDKRLQKVEDEINKCINGLTHQTNQI